MGARKKLPNRRPSETFELEYGGVSFYATVGYNAVGEPKEVFVNARKQGSMMDASLADAAVLVSRHLQSGTTAAELAGSVSRSGGTLSHATEPASPIAVIVDLLATEEVAE